MIKEIAAVEEHLLLNLSGSIYVLEAAQLRESLTDYIQKGHNAFILDFTEVDYIDSAGLGTLLYIRNRALANGGSIIIKGLQGIVKDLFELTQLNRVFEIQ
jgi:anti-sigma B factor antagonist